MDMLANIPAVNGPETESLGFNHVIDAYRQFAGPANLAGKRVISSELGAQRNEPYSQTMPELIWDVKRSIVGSINNFVSRPHSFSYSYFEMILTTTNQKGVPCISFLRFLSQHDMAWLHHFLVPLFQHAWAQATHLGILR